MKPSSNKGEAARAGVRFAGQGRQSMAFLVAALLTGCTAHTPPHTGVDADVPGQWISTTPSGKLDADAGWIQRFKDPRLEALVREALAGNRNLESTAADLDRAAAQARRAGAALGPSVDLSSRFEYRDSNVPIGAGTELFQTEDTQHGVSLDVSWEADVWGRIRAGADAALYEFYAAENDYVFARYSLAAQTVKAYFRAVETARRKQLARDFHSVLERTLEVTEAFYEEGLLSLQDVHLVKADLARAGESFQNAESARLDALRSLEILLGRYPAADAEIPAVFPPLPEPAPAGVPSQVLERRPDLKAAERRVAAAFFRTEQARAAKLPAITLTGSLGTSSSELSNLVDSTNVIWNVAGGVLFPIFNAGKLDAQVDINSAEQRAALAGYQQTALEALSEVETALRDEQLFRRRQENLSDAVANARTAEEIAEANFEAGQLELLDLLQIRQRTINARIDRTRARRELLEQHVDLQLALGGTVFPLRQGN